MRFSDGLWFVGIVQEDVDPRPVLTLNTALLPLVRDAHSGSEGGNTRARTWKMFQHIPVTTSCAIIFPVVGFVVYKLGCLTAHQIGQSVEEARVVRLTLNPAVGSIALDHWAGLEADNGHTRSVFWMFPTFRCSAAKCAPARKVFSGSCHHKGGCPRI